MLDGFAKPLRVKGSIKSILTFFSPLACAALSIFKSLLSIPNQSIITQLLFFCRP
jgi:hypothetical protein